MHYSRVLMYLSEETAQSVGTPPPPEWFSKAVGTPAEDRSVDFGPVQLHYRAWGAGPAAPVLLVHGGAAHAHWWDHVAPLLTGGRRVVALDLTGHGDSDRRDRYSLDLWAQELLAVAEAEATGSSPIVVGHSMGGAVALRAAATYGTHLEGAVVIDTPIRELTPEDEAARLRLAFGPLRTYATREEAIARFRTIPDGPTLPFIAPHIAGHSLRPVPGGWTWKFDPRVFDREPLNPDAITVVDCRAALFRAEHGLLTEAMSADVYDRMGYMAPVITVPGAGHHVMLDQPLALVTGLLTLLATWEHSTPTAAQAANLERPHTEREA